MSQVKSEPQYLYLSLNLLKRSPTNRNIVIIAIVIISSEKSKRAIKLTVVLDDYFRSDNYTTQES